ncbi:hypothetical protein FH972_023562 [Carpinus fangiana]|uniref:Wax synthase domain-containing protein n=1 Tax=Carpinus fangiana TaxID=176857 RepID=A0A5N6KVX5_9ROSI|nr:hypothetical protein FH972_023562 [Carpinus fangiana]
MLVDASPRSAQDVIAYHKQKYNEGVQDGSIIPFTYPMFSLGLAVVVVFMLIPPQSPFDTPLTRWAVVTFMAYWHVWIIVNCRSFNEAPSFGIGIVSACLILWTATTLIFHDSKREFKRIESKTYVRHRGEWWGLKKPRVAQEAEAEAEESSNRRMSNGNSAVHSLKKMGGQADLKATADSQSAKTSATPSAAEEAPSNEYFWQGYPSGPLIERLDWVADLYCSFRGTGWNWLISGLPGPPHHIQAQLSSPSPNSLASVHRSTSLPISRAGVPRFDTFRASILHTTWLLTSGYIALDACLTLITHDPYFWGLTSAPVPAFLPAPLHTSWALARAYRLVLSMTLIWLCLRTFFALAPLVYVGALGPRRLGPRGEPWLYPDHYGAAGGERGRGVRVEWGVACVRQRDADG